MNVDSVLIADVTFEESTAFHAVAASHGIALIFICPPNADNNLLRKICFDDRSYTYLLSRAGVAGTESPVQLRLHYLIIINKLREYHVAPPLHGFSIFNSAKLKSALRASAIGVISSSAIVKIIGQN